MSSGNVLIIARKEFSDLLSDKMILVTICVYLLLSAASISAYYSGVSANKILNVYGATTGELLYVLIEYGAIVGIIIGVTSISNERRNNALNILISKPLYRDTIINGKLIGSFCALLCIFILVAAFYTAGLLIFCGNFVAPFLFDYAMRLPVQVIVALIYVMVFICLAMSISILVKDYAVAVILSIFSWSILLLFQSSSFAGVIVPYITSHISVNYHDAQTLFESLSPHTMIDWISNSGIFDPSVSFTNGLNSMMINVVELLIYMAVAVIICYIAFLRSDVQ
jgi:ABC-2 type transport system permease protein